MRNVTLLTSNGLVYSWGDNLLTGGSHGDGYGDGWSEPDSRFSDGEEWLGDEESMCRSVSSEEGSVEGRLAGERAGQDPSASSYRKHLATYDDDDLAAMVDMLGAARDCAGGTDDTASDGRGEGEVRPKTHSAGRVWEAMTFPIDWDEVKSIAMPILSHFTFRTNGSCLSPRIPGIGWSFFGADPDWGVKQAEQLTVELMAALAKFDVKVVSQIPGSIEIVPRVLHRVM